MVLECISVNDSFDGLEGIEKILLVDFLISVRCLG